MKVFIGLAISTLAYAAVLSGIWLGNEMVNNLAAFFVWFLSACSVIAVIKSGFDTIKDNAQVALAAEMPFHRYRIYYMRLLMLSVLVSLVANGWWFSSIFWIAFWFCHTIRTVILLGSLDEYVSLHARQ